MGTMTVGLVIAGVAVVGVVVFVLRWRMASGEQQALRHYQNALDTLRTVSDRMESSRPAVSPTKQADDEPALGSPRRPAPRADLTGADLARADRTAAGGAPAYRISESRVKSPIREGPSREGLARNGSATAPHVVTRTGADRASSVGFGAEPETASGSAVVSPGSSGAPPGDDPRSIPEVHPAIVFEEDDTVVDPADSRSSGPYALARPTRSSRRALQRSSRPSSRVPTVLGVLIAVVVIAVAVAVALGATSHHHTTSPPVHSGTTAPAHTGAKTTTTVSMVPPTTAPPTVQPEAATVTMQSASYAAPSSAYTVTLSSSGACWVYAKLASTGAVVWTGTLDAGQAQTLEATGGLIVELGHANSLSATLNGIPVDYPAQYQAVFTMTFVPAVA